MRQATRSTLCFLFLYANVAGAEEPSLPPGLGGSEPSLPAGLGVDEPALPAGLDSLPVEIPANDRAASDWKESLPFDFTGYAETRLGTRLQSDATQKSASIGEARLHLGATKSWEGTTASLAGDFLYDPVLDSHSVELESGEGWFDLREANLLFRPTDFSDIKVGRQILTWGTGDLIFINDLFPKDWNSFFIGRDEEYLKAPSDALKIALFHAFANLDIAYTPRFDSDRFIDGRRISYFNQNAGNIVGRNMPVLVDKPSRWFSEDEIALRLYRMINAYETALYYYDGYWKSPNGQDAASGLFTFPALSVYGASIRGPLAGGIGNAELGYYDSRDDSSGNNPLIRNSEWRLLVGYERELLAEFTGSVQYYLERIDNHDAYRATLPAGVFAKDKNRHVVTVRLTKLLMNQNLTLSLFNFYSPSDEDGYLRPKINYKLDDNWTLETGGNLFFGKRNETFFGQFEDNSNVYVSVRYGF